MEMEYRVLWEEEMAFMDGPKRVSFGGRVYSDFAEAATEADSRKNGYNYHRVHIEVRERPLGTLKSPWPRPWDKDKADTPRYC